MKNSIISMILLFAAVSSYAQDQEGFKCINYEKAGLVFPSERSCQDRFYARTDSLIRGKHENMNIWLVGGSHVQGDIFADVLMGHFHSLTGHGDRGILFPRQLSNTHSDRRYEMTAEGKWHSPMMTRPTKDERPRYGINGFSARCDSHASIKLNIDPKGTGGKSFKRVRLLGYASSDKAYPEIIMGRDTIRSLQDTIHHSYIFNLPRKTDSLSVNFIVPEGENFVFRGLMPLCGKRGFNFIASGANGASLTYWGKRCAEMDNDLLLIKPDLVIFMLGINDSACSTSHFSSSRFKSNFRVLIQKIKASSPDCAMIFITNNDSYRYARGGMVPNENGDTVRGAMMELAYEYGACVWDLYGIMGGKGSVHSWREAGLIKKDRLHFTNDGYRLLADMLFEAIMKDKENN